MHIPYTAHVTNEEVRKRTGQTAVSRANQERHLRLFGHIASADPTQDHRQAVAAAVGIGCPRNGDALPVAGVKYGYVLSRATSGHVTKGCLWHGGSLRAVSVGASSWNQLCTSLADDDDD